MSRSIRATKWLRPSRWVILDTIVWRRAASCGGSDIICCCCCCCCCCRRDLPRPAKRPEGETGLHASFPQLFHTNFFPFPFLKGLRWTLTRQKPGFFFSRDTSAIPTITYDGTPQRLVTQILKSLLLVMEVCTQPLKIWQTTLGLP
jgi:hypothetical protein